MSEKTKPTSSYFETRMKLLGITPENNKIGLHQTDLKTGNPIVKDFPIFSQVPEGIKIIVYTLERLQIRTKPREMIDPNSGFGKVNGNRWKKDFAIIRLEKPMVRDNGSIMKYRLPKGAGTHPFFPPSLIDKYENRIKIDTLYCTEGYFKAFKAALNGIDIVGLSSITHMKDSETGKLHPDIIKLMQACSVKKMVWLTDGDALDITQDELKDGHDLSKRPKGFFASVITFKTLLDDYEDIEKWFFHIDTDNILLSNPGKLREDVKGIDDLLISLTEKTKQIITDLKSVNTGTYFQKFNITYGTGKVYNHFNLRDVKDFYLFHVERRPELKNIEFVFNGTRYQYNEESGDCDVKIPGAAKLYFRVSDDYYKFISIPNQYEQLEKIFQSRRKGTIADDHGPKFTKYVPKYEAFCNVPDHNNFQQIIHNCFNVYSPLDFFPDDEECFEEDCPTIMSFLKHLFGVKKVSFTDHETKEKKEYTILELGLDYLQLQYQKPSQKLPILCLVSRENNTGKSTMANFLRMMLGANVAIVGNADLLSDFNAHWASKSVVVCDETKIDKDHVIEKIKSLSTAKKIFMNAKGRGHVELDCFIKFVLITNNEDSFIRVTDEDIRYWIIKVPKLSIENPNILDIFREEMPAFLSFINKRKMVTEHMNRMWFHPQLLKTDALKRVIAQSQSGLEKTLRIFFRDLFLKSGKDEIRMSMKNIIYVSELKENKYQPWYVEKCLKEDLKLSVPQKFSIQGYPERYKSEEDAVSMARKIFPDLQDTDIINKISGINVNSSYYYPLYTVDKSEIEYKKDNGKAYILKRKDFVTTEEEMDKVIDEVLEEDVNENDDMPF